MLNDDAIAVFGFLTRIEYGLGAIGLADYQERTEILHWLSDSDLRFLDPRGSSPPGAYRQGAEPSENSEAESAPDIEASTHQETTGATLRPPEESVFQFTPAGLKHRWVFTKNDDDFYPSVPHGHLNDKTNPWPKLNPYTGRAFSAKDQESLRHRLQKSDLQVLWNNSQFRSHALLTIAWYSEAHPYYRFPVDRPFKLPRKR